MGTLASSVRPAASRSCAVSVADLVDIVTACDTVAVGGSPGACVSNTMPRLGVTVAPRNRPVSSLVRVVFPDPLGPMIAVSLLAGKRVSTLPYLTVTSTPPLVGLVSLRKRSTSNVPIARRYWRGWRAMNVGNAAAISDNTANIMRIAANTYARCWLTSRST